MKKFLIFILILINYSCSEEQTTQSKVEKSIQSYIKHEFDGFNYFPSSFVSFYEVTYHDSLEFKLKVLQGDFKFYQEINISKSKRIQREIDSLNYILNSKSDLLLGYNISHSFSLTDSLGMTKKSNYIFFVSRDFKVLHKSKEISYGDDVVLPKNYTVDSLEMLRQTLIEKGEY